VNWYWWRLWTLFNKMRGIVSTEYFYAFIQHSVASGLVTDCHPTYINDALCDRDKRITFWGQRSWSRCDNMLEMAHYGQWHSVLMPANELRVSGKDGTMLISCVDFSSSRRAKLLLIGWSARIAWCSTSLESSCRMRPAGSYDVPTTAE